MCLSPSRPRGQSHFRGLYPSLYSTAAGDGKRQPFTGWGLAHFSGRFGPKNVPVPFPPKGTVPVNGYAARRYFAARSCNAFSIDAATFPANAFEPSAVKWTLAGRWISFKRGKAKAYRSFTATALSSITFLAAAL